MHYSKQIEQQIATFERVKHEYPALAKAWKPIELPAAPIRSGYDRITVGPESKRHFLWVTRQDRLHGKIHLWWRVHHYLVISKSMWNESQRTTKGDKDAELSLTASKNLAAEPSIVASKTSSATLLSTSSPNSDAHQQSVLVMKLPISRKISLQWFRIYGNNLWGIWSMDCPKQGP